MRNLKTSLKTSMNNGCQGKREKNKIWIGLTILLAMTVLLSLCLGAAHLTPAEVLQGLLSGPKSSLAGTIIWYARIPRTAACLLAGMGLAVSGAVIQNVLANKLASPGIIGVNAGAGLAVTVCCALGILSGTVIATSAFLGALAAVLLITITAQKMGASRTTVILGGVAVNSFLNAASEAVRTLVPDAGVLSGDFRVGGFTAVATSRLLPAGILILFAFIILLTLCNELDILNLGETSAQGLGLPVKKMRTIFLVLASLLAGASVSFAGLLGFVGLIVPHIGRRLTGGESRMLLVFCALGGAFIVTLSDLLGRLLFQPYEIPVGILMSFIGGPFFLFLLFRNKGGHHHD